jgi:hypothetical protein
MTKKARANTTANVLTPVKNASRQARCNAIKGSTLTQLKDLELESR